MPWPKKRPENSGRKKGTPNAERKELYTLLAKKFPGYNPVFAMAEIALDKKNLPDLRLQAHKEVAKYTFPQLKAVEVNGNIDSIQVVRFIYDDGNSDQTQAAT